jgi:CHAT domain-containing protein/Tfp pilus assembly protein PilF
LMTIYFPPPPGRGLKMKSLLKVIGFIIIACGLFCLLGSAGSLPPIGSFQLLFDRSVVLRRAGDYREAILASAKALELAKSEGSDRHQLDCLVNLGALDWNIGDLKRSRESFAEALALSQKLEMSSAAAQCSTALRIHDLYEKGKEGRLQRRFQESIRNFRMAIEMGRRIGQPEFELKCLRQLSLDYLELEAMDQYLSLNEQALVIARKLKHRTEEGRCLNNMGLYFFRSNRYSRALALYDEALAIAKETSKNGTDETDCLNNIALVYLGLGDYAKALRSMNEALVADYAIHNLENVIIDLKNTGTILRNRGESKHWKTDIYASLTYSLKCLDLARQRHRERIVTELLNNLGLTYSSLGQYRIALGHFSAALAKAKALGRKGDTGTILCNIGQTYLQIGDFTEAKKFFLRAIDLALKADRDEVLWETYFGLGKCLENDGELDSALSCFRKAADIIDMIRRRLAWDIQKTGFARDKWKVYEAWIDALFQSRQVRPSFGSEVEIWRTIERAKARAFLEELYQVENPRRVPVDSRDLFAQRQLTRRISQTISRLAEDGASKEKRRALLDSLERVEDEYSGLINRFRVETADSLVLPDERLSLDMVQKTLLDPESAILEFFLGEKRSFQVLITQTQLVIRPLPGRATIEDSLRAYLKLLASPPKGGLLGIEAARRIYRELISPLEARLSSSIRNLVVIPDGILCYLPFETLVRDSRDRAESGFLIETYQVSYAPSVSSLALLSRPRSADVSPGRILALGSPAYARRHSNGRPRPKQSGDVLREIYLESGFDFSELPYSKKEVQQISRVFAPECVDTYTGYDAREEVIKRASLRDYRIIHFACHGFLDESAPLRSALVLSLDDDLEEDGFLQAREIYELRLNADLVILSACQTGRGRLENGEGVLGLPRTFFCAGARSTISSLWKISDRSTSSLMKNFYRFLANGSNKAEALRQAKLEMLRSGLRHPFYWAGLVLNGDYRSRLTGMPVSR